jgi:serine/threonine protein kinase
VILYQMLTGQMPFQDTSEILDRDPVPVSQRVPTVPPRLDEICSRCLAKAMGDRYPSASALASDLRELLAASTQPPLQVAVVSDHRSQIANLRIVSRSVGAEPLPAEPARLPQEGLGTTRTAGWGRFANRMRSCSSDAKSRSPVCTNA